MKHQQSLILLFYFTALSLGFCQDLLTVEETVKVALENNYQIITASNALKIDEYGASPGLAGMLPTVQARVVDNNSRIFLAQTRIDGTTQERNNAINNSFNYGAALDWTLFDGLRMFANLEELKENKKLGDAELKQVILTTVGDVMITYYDLAQQQQQLAALDSTIRISKQRVELAQNRFTIGKASKLEVLNAEVDLNTDETLMLRQKELYANTKIRLNQLLARDLETDFVVAQDIIVDTSLLLPELETSVINENPQLLAIQINKRIEELQLKQIKAARYPTLNATTGYNLGETESTLGFITSSNFRGFTYGFGATLNLFDGFNQRRNEKIGELEVTNAEVAIAEQKLGLMSLLESTYQTYTTNVSLIALEAKNETIAKENLDITVEKFKIGTIPALEFRTAQLNFINAQVRLSNAMFQAKLSEIVLKQLAGDLSL